MVISQQVDGDFHALPLDAVTDSAISTAKALGASHVDAVNNFRWNESPVELLNRIKAVGASSITQPREWAGDVERASAPAVIFEQFNMSTVSPGS
jgi:alkylation response protein AidB-like acyl-CoA dehydrogenase